MRVLALCVLGLSLGGCSARSNQESGSKTTSKAISGYTYGSHKLPKAPISLEELSLLEKTVLLTDEDKKYLKISKGILKDQIDDILDVWYGFVGSNEHLVYYFGYKKGSKPNSEYLDRVRKRFGQWILDTAEANYDQQWLDYQFEIGRRHHRVSKNKTDNSKSVDIIHYRYLPTLIAPVTITLKPFLAKKGHSASDIEKMHTAWVKSVILQITLWSYPYVKTGDF